MSALALFGGSFCWGADLPLQPIRLSDDGRHFVRGESGAKWVAWGLPEDRRWACQAAFWEAVAKTCRQSPAVFCYDLMNEPVLPGDMPETDWLGGELGGKYFVQRLALDLAGRSREQIAEAWVNRMVDAIRKHDRRNRRSDHRRVAREVSGDVGKDAGSLGGLRRWRGTGLPPGGCRFRPPERHQPGLSPTTERTFLFRQFSVKEPADRPGRSCPVAGISGLCRRWL